MEQTLKTREHLNLVCFSLVYCYNFFIYLFFSQDTEEIATNDEEKKTVDLTDITELSINADEVTFPNETLISDSGREQ